MSFIEALTNSIIGLCVAVLLTMYALPFWGYEPTIIESFEITALFFVAGFIRNWIIRAVFHRYASRGASQNDRPDPYNTKHWSHSRANRSGAQYARPLEQRGGFFLLDPPITSLLFEFPDVVPLARMPAPGFGVLTP